MTVVHVCGRPYLLRIASSIANEKTLFILSSPEVLCPTTEKNLTFYFDQSHPSSSLSNLLSTINSHVPSKVVIVEEGLHSSNLTNLFTRLQNTTSNLYVSPAWIRDGMQLQPTDLHGVLCISTWGGTSPKVKLAVKRMADVIFAILLLFPAIPLLLLSSILVKCEDGGPILFKQERYGRHGLPFLVYKLRTMKTTYSGSTTQVIKGDYRLTKVGGFLRRFSIDELPQLFNVIKGDMSLVGPRPHASDHNELYRVKIEGYMQRHQIRPGITGLAQVRGLRGNTENISLMERRIQEDLRYISHWSLRTDLLILVLTLLTLFRYHGE